MTHLKTFETFTKEYGETLKPDEFSKIKRGTTVRYLGTTYIVSNNNGYILELTNSKKTITVNLSQFNISGMII